MTKSHGIDHLIGPYLYDDVSAKERAAVESHLQRCAACRADVQALRVLIRAIPRDALQAQAAAKARTLHAVQSRIAKQRVRRQGRRRWPAIACAAALVASAAFALGLWIGCRLPRQRPAPPTGVAIERPTGPSALPPSVPKAGMKGNIAGTNEGTSVRHKQQEPSDTGERVVSPHRPAPQVGPEQRRPPAAVQMARVAPGPVFAPSVVGLDDVTQTSVSQD